MHEKTRGNRKESPWTAVRADQQIGGRCSVGACVSVGEAVQRVRVGLMGRRSAACA
jgi:hypothetical protein